MSRGLKSLVAVAAVVLLVVLGTRLLGDDDSPPSAEPGAPSASETLPAAPDDTPAEGMYVRSTITDDGEVRVQTWVRAPQPLQELDLTTTDPDLAPGSVESLDLVVRSMDESSFDKVLARRDSVGTNRQTVRLRSPATDLYFSYTIDGALSDASETVQGRQLVRVLGMDVAYEGAAGPVVRFLSVPGTVLSVGCLSPREDFDATPRPCGGASGDGDWRVELTGDQRNDRLLASIES